MAITGHDVGYLRVSSVDQNLERQLEGVSLDERFEDHASGGSTNRPGWKACLAHLRAGDTLHVHSIDRLARNLNDLLSILTVLLERGVAVRFHKEGLHFTGKDEPFQRLQLQIIGAVSEFERSMIRERQREGIALAKAKGRYKGRKPALSDEQAQVIRRRIGQGEKVSALAAEYGVSRQTVYSRVLGA